MQVQTVRWTPGISTPQQILPSPLSVMPVVPPKLTVQQILQHIQLSCRDVLAFLASSDLSRGRQPWSWSGLIISRRGPSVTQPVHRPLPA